MKKIMIYGAGAMGTILGAYLARAGEDVTLVSRNESHIAAMREKGATVVGKEQFTVPVSACLPEELKEQFDIVFLQTKQRDNSQTALFLKDYLTEKGVVCTLQNGMPELSLAETLQREKVYGATCVWGATFRSAGVSELTSEERSFSLGGLEPDKEILSDIAMILSKMGTVKVEENLLGARMAKLCVNAAFSSLSTITGFTFGRIVKKRSLNRIALKIINECFAVSKAVGIRIEPIQGHDMEKLLTANNFFKEWVAGIALRIAMKKHNDLTSGMLHDLQKGRKCDIDFVNGVIVSLGKQYGVPVPYNEKAVAIVHDIENGLCELAPETAEFFKEI